MGWNHPVVLRVSFGTETWPTPEICLDKDGDGYGNPASRFCPHPNEWDCDDSDPDINPAVLEGPYGDPVCADLVDNDCDHVVDDLPGGCSPWVMANIPADTFNMGDSFAPEGDDDELPVHKLSISAFEMDPHEVTNAEYNVCFFEGAGACTGVKSWSSYSRSWYNGNPDYDDFPVINVTWEQAKDYCAWAGKRLPTEAEWELAARGGLDGARYPWGDSISGEDANYWKSVDPWDNDTSPVEYYDPNGYGLYDMAGNVQEWVGDWYSPTYYQYCVNNRIEQDPLGPSDGTHRVMRGGSWFHSPDDLRTANRDDLGPADYGDYLGFRCVR